jgi:Concanavalin A-like lectin/glucanases superfamily
MAANGISTHYPKSERALLKLQAAAAKRSQVGTTGYRALHYLSNPLTHAPVPGHPWQLTPAQGMILNLVARNTNSWNRTGTIWHDLTSNHNNATVVGNPTYSDNGMVLSGEGQYAYLAPGVYFRGDFTIVAWVYLNSYASWSRIIDFGDGAEAANLVILAATDGPLGYPVMRVGGTQFEANEQIPLGEWVQVAARMSGTEGRIFINGEKVGHSAGPWNDMTPAVDSVRQHCYIGHSNYAGDADLDGSFGELQIYNYALSDSDILGAYNDLYPVYHPPTYSLATAGSVTSVDEGAALTFNVTTTNVANGTVLPWTVDGGALGPSGYTITSGRFSPGTTGSVTINNNTGTFTVTVSADNFTAPQTQAYNISLQDPLLPTPIGNTVEITVNDTSQEGHVDLYGFFENQLVAGTWMTFDETIGGIRVQSIVTNFDGSLNTVPLVTSSLQHGSYIKVNGTVIASDHSLAPDGTDNRVDIPLNRGTTSSDPGSAGFGNEYGVGFWMQRGHTITILDPVTAISRAGFPKCYDTYALVGVGPIGTEGIANDIKNAAAGDIIVMGTYDATSISTDMRNAMTTYTGANTYTNTYSQTRISHMFLGKRKQLSGKVISLNPNYIATNGGTSIPNDTDEGSTSATVAGTFTSSSAQGGTLTFNSIDSRIILPAKDIKTIGMWIKLINPDVHNPAYLLDSRLHDVFLAGSGSGYFYSGGIEDWTLLSINGAPADNSSWAAVVTNVNVWQYVTVISQTTKTDSISLFSRYTHDESLFEFQVGRIEAWDYIQLDSQIAAAYASHSSNYV